MSMREKKQFKITLITPYKKNMSSASMENLGIGYLAGTLRKSKYNVTIIDASLYMYSTDETIERILVSKPNMVGISLASAIYHQEAKAIICGLRERGFEGHITIGGYYPTMHFELLEELNCNSILYGEGDYSIVLLANKLDTNQDWSCIPSLAYLKGDKVIVNENLPRIRDLDILPLPVRDNIKHILENGKVVAMSTSRGCYGECSFCAIQSVFHKDHDLKQWVGRSARNIVMEMKILSEIYGVKEIWFMDPNFLGDINSSYNRVKDFIEIIKREQINITFCFECRTNDVTNNEEIFKRLKEVGLRRVFIGVESGIQRALNMYNKGTSVDNNMSACKILKELDINAQIGFILYDPYTTMEEINENIKFIYQIGSYLSYANLGRNWLGILQSTPIYNQLTNQGVKFNEEGGGYKMQENVKEYMKIIDYFIAQYNELFMADRISWRDFYNMHNDNKGNKIVKNIRKLSNEIILEFMDILCNFYLENRSASIKEVINFVKDKKQYFDGRVEVLKGELSNEINYRNSKNMLYEVV